MHLIITPTLTGYRAHAEDKSAEGISIAAALIEFLSTYHDYSVVIEREKAEEVAKAA